MRRYRMPDGRTYQFDEDKAPACAVEVKVMKPEAKKPKAKKAKKETEE